MLGLLAAVWLAHALPDDRLVLPGAPGTAGGRLVLAQRTEPKTLNWLFATDSGTREVLQRLMADLIHINRHTLSAEPALAQSWKGSADGLQWVLDLRQVWNPGQKTPATPWEAEIDGLMRCQMVTREYTERKRLFDRVQEILVENQPLVALVSPNLLVGAKKYLANFRPALLEPYTLWNIEQPAVRN